MSVQFDMQLRHFLVNFLLVANQNRSGDSFLNQFFCSSENFFVIPFRKYNSFRIALGLVNNHTHDLFRFTLLCFKVLDVFGHVFDGLAGNTAVHGGLGNSRRYMQQDSRVKRLGDDIVGPKDKLLVAVGFADRVGTFFARQLCQGFDGSKLHLFVNAAGATIKGSPEDKRKTEDIVDLVAVVGTAGGDHDVASYGKSIFRGDFRVGICHRKDNRIRGHARDHLFGKCSLYREAEQDVGAGGGLLQRTKVCVGGKELFVGIHPFDASLVDDALGVAHDHVVRLDTKRNGEFCTGVGGSAGSVDDDTNVFNFFVNQIQRVEQSRG